MERKQVMLWLPVLQKPKQRALALLTKNDLFEANRPNQNVQVPCNIQENEREKRSFKSESIKNMRVRRKISMSSALQQQHECTDSGMHRFAFGEIVCLLFSTSYLHVA